ncbi:hypothetical protein BC828DRAFT_203299 [Blastocladiella britannica]|nr:hypothetical protein BC828DRAFT_203299 [Blastocladiella britannica]
MIGGSIDNSTPLLDHVQVAAHCLLFSGPGRALRDTLARPLPLLEYCRRTLPLLRQHASFSGPPGSLDGFDGSSRGKGLNGLSLPGYSRGTPLLVAASLPLLLAATPWLHPRSHLECIESFRGALSDLREAISAVQSPPQPQPTSPPTSPRFGSFADAAGVNNDQKPVSDLALWTLTVMAAVLARVLASGPHGAPIRQTSIKMEAVARASQKVAELLAGEWIRSSIDAGRAGWLLGPTSQPSRTAPLPPRC